MRPAHFFLVVFFFLTLPLGAKEIFVINEDDSHFYGSRRPEQMNLDGLHAFIDQYADTQVSHLFLCPNSQCADFRSKTRDAVWDHLDRAEGVLWFENAKRLFDAGLDPYAVWIDRCREKGISPWISMRMNDVHDALEVEHWIHSSFWRDHPEWWRRPNSETKVWVDRSLNYAVPEVYAYNLAFAAEILERYDADGIELDWMRFGFHLTPGKEAEEAPILTRFVAEVHKLAEEWSQKRGHKVSVAVRVPTHPDAAAGLGMDAVDWAKKGLVDWIVPAPFWRTTDYDIPVGLWKERVAGTGVKVIPCAEHSTSACHYLPMMPNSLQMLAGWADTMRYRGAEGLYLFNWMDCQTLPVLKSEYEFLLKNGPAAAENPVYPLAYRDTVPEGFSNGEQLPRKLAKGAEFTVPHGSDLGAVHVLLGVSEDEPVPTGVTLNGKTALSAEKVPNVGLEKVTPFAVRYTFPNDAVRVGENQISVPAQKGAKGEIRWVEMN